MAIFQFIDTSLPVRSDGTVRIRVQQSDGNWFELDVKPNMDFEVKDPRVIKILRLDPKYREVKS
jgi:hypothetical protein